jgi:hypothetical protein
MSLNYAEELVFLCKNQEIIQELRKAGHIYWQTGDQKMGKDLFVRENCPWADDGIRFI